MVIFIEISPIKIWTCMGNLWMHWTPIDWTFWISLQFLNPRERNCSLCKKRHFHQHRPHEMFWTRVKPCWACENRHVTFSSTSPPSKFYPPHPLSWSTNDDFHQHRPQYALRTIDHTTLDVNQNSRIGLNNVWRTNKFCFYEWFPRKRRKQRFKWYLQLKTSFWNGCFKIVLTWFLIDF